MADVTINTDEAPSEQLVRQAKREAVVTDEKGRKIRLVRPGPLAQFNLVKLVGGEAAANSVYMGMTLPLIFVQAIDDALVPPPQTQRELEALIERLEDEGITAVMNGVAEHFGATDTAKAAEDVKK